MALEWLAALLSLVGRQQRSAAAPAPRPQHNAAFALYGLSDNEDNLLEFVREGAVQRINECELVVQASKDCVNKLMKRLQVRDAPRRGPLGAVQGRGVG